MPHPWASFLEGHASLRTAVATACRSAAGAAALDEPSLRRELEALHRVLSHGLLRHIDVEDRVLYPVLARAEGQVSVDLLAMDHRAISALERDVAVAEHALSDGELDPEQRLQLVRSLHGLEMLVDLHMTKEEQVCLPALDRELDAASRRDLEDSLETLEMAEQLAD